MVKWLKRVWCEAFHAGGMIARDENGEINWRCSTCGRWGHPVPREIERHVVDRHIAARRSARNGEGE